MKWDDEPRRDMLRVLAPDTPRVSPQRRRKDKRRWCRGKVGTEHETDTRLRPHQTWPREAPFCFRPDWLPERWYCKHERYCVNCGKILLTGFGSECPDFTTEVGRWRERA